MPKLSPKGKKQCSQAYQGLDAKQKHLLKQNLDAARYADPTVTRIRKYRLQPNPAQHHVLITWMRDYHHTYNWCLQYVREHKIHVFRPDMKEPNWDPLKEQLRVRFVYATAFKDQPWHRQLVLRTPKEMRDKAVGSVIAVLEQGWTNFHKKQACIRKYPHSRAAKRPWKFVLTFKARRRWTSGILEFPGKSLTLHSGQEKDASTIDLYRLWDVHNPTKRIQVQDRKSLNLPWQHRDKQKKPEYPMRGLKLLIHEHPAAEDLNVYCEVHYWHGHFFLLVPETLKANSRARKPLVSADDVVAHWTQVSASS